MVRSCFLPGNAMVVVRWNVLLLWALYLRVSVGLGPVDWNRTTATPFVTFQLTPHSSQLTVPNGPQLSSPGLVVEIVQPRTPGRWCNIETAQHVHTWQPHLACHIHLYIYIYLHHITITHSPKPIYYNHPFFQFFTIAHITPACRHRPT